MRKKIIKKAVAILTIVALLMPSASQVYAADSVKGIQVNADSSQLDKAAEEAKKSGAEITKGNTEDKGTVETKAEAEAKLAEIEADYKKQIEKLKEAKLAMDEYKENKAKYDKLKEKYDKDLEKYQKDYKEYEKKYEEFKKQYEEEKKKMEDALKEYEKNKDKDGYLSSPYAKTLVYDSEPDAHLTLSDNQGKYMSAKAVDTAFSRDIGNYSKNLLQLDNMSVKDLEESGSPVNSMQLYGNFGDKSGWKTNVSNTGTVKWATVLLKRGESVTATYTNLKKTYYNGKKISKIVFKYTLTSDSTFRNSSKTAWLGIFTDPTLGVFASAYTGENEKDTSIFVKNEFVFYDQDNKPIEFKDALLSVASLNREHNSIELAKDYTPGQFVKISGSSVGEDTARKMIYATASLNFKKDEGGCKYSMYKRDGEPESGWDSADAPNSWYGAGAIKLQGPKNQITLGAASATKILDPPYGPTVTGKDNTEGKKPNIWYSLNGKIRAIGIPEIKAKEPNKPVPPTPPAEPKKPYAKVEYHYSVFYVKSKAEKKVYNAQGQDINDKVVKKDSVVDFELNTSDFPKGHENIDSLVFSDKLPEDYELDLNSTKAKSPDYDVEYTRDTRTLKFTAKAELLTKINQDLTKEAKVPSPKITGKVTKAGKTYENKFDLNINNKYKVESNPVKVHTPTDPVKKVFKKGDTTVNIDGKRVEPGQELTYAIEYKNTTGHEVTATIEDKIPAHTTFVSADNNGQETNGVVKWTAKVGQGQSLKVTFTVKVNKNVNGNIVTNEAKVLDGKNEYKTNETKNPTPTEPKKEVFKENTTINIDGKRVEPEEVLTYAITYKNTTGEKVTAKITDEIPKHTSFVSAENGGKYSNGIVTWEVPVEKDKSVTVKFNVKVDKKVSGNIVTNEAKVYDGKNEYKTNEVTNPTPTGPEKKVFKSETTTNIDGKRVEAGELLDYAITYKNTTGEDVTATITDKLPEYTEFVSADNGGVNNGGTITWSNKTVGKDKSITVKFKVKVKESVNGEVIKNKAKVNDGKNNYDTNEVTNPTPTKPKKDVYDAADEEGSWITSVRFRQISYTSIDGKRVEAGQELVYAITYKNTTGEKVTATIKDKIPQYTEFVSAEDGGTFKDGVVTWTKEVDKDESITVKFRVKVKADVSGEVLKNKAKVNDGKNEYDTNEVTNPTPTKPEKKVFKTGTQTSIDGKRVEAGEILDYAITYKNTTGDKVTATITDKIPQYTEFVSADNNGKHENETVTWTKEVDKNQSITVTFKVKVKADVNGEVIKNKAKVNDGKNDYDTNEVTNPTPTKPKKDVFTGGSTTSIDGKRVEAGQELTYKITYTNTTGDNVKATITDKLPDFTEFVSADNDGSHSNGIVKWTKDVDKGKSITVSFKVKVKKDINGEVLKNKAKVNDGKNEYDTNEVTNPTPTGPKKDVFKSGTTISIDGKRVEAGQELTYAIDYKNTTDKDVTVTITDKIPAHTKFISADNGGREVGGVVIWTAKVEKGKSIRVTFKVKVDPDVNGEIIKNKANVFDGKNNYETNEVTNPTPTKPEKKVFTGGTQTNIDGKRVEAGQELTYAITYKNTTGEDVTAKITDNIPQYTEFVSADNGGTNNNGTVTWTKEVEKDKSITVTFKVRVKADVNGEVLKNKAKVNDGKNDYDTNEVTNPTPTKPKKEVFKAGTTINIDGKRVEPEQVLTYAITYKNTTGADVTAKITDKIPEYTEFVAAENGGKHENGTVTWEMPVKKDESVTVKFSVKVKKDVNGKVVKNDANVFDGKNNYKTNEVTNPTPTKPEKKVFTGGTQTNIDGKRVEAGQELTYAITYKNTTGEKVTAKITDKIPQYTEFVSADNDGVNNNGTVTWTKEVEKDKSITVTFKVKVKADVNGEVLKNKAKVNDGKNDYDTNEVTNPTPTGPKKDVFKSGTTISIDGKRVEAGQELTYAIDYKNTTDKDVTATITDKIPAHTKFISADNGGREVGGVVIWTAKVEKGKSIRVTFKVKVDPDVNGEIIKNKANVFDGKNNYETNEVTNPTPTKPEKKVFTGGTQTNIDGKRVEAGQELTYAITYKNTTGEKVTAKITDKIPQYTEFVSADNGGTNNNGTVTWTKEVEKDKSITVTFKVKVKADVNGEVLKNKAKVNDGKNDYDTNEVTNPTPTKPEKKVFKSGTTTNIDGKRVEAGQILDYAITYKNTTGEKVTATITDKIPQYTEFVSADNGGTNNNGTVTWTKEVEKDKSITVTFKVKVKADVNGKVVKNEAKVNDGTNDYDTNEVINPTPTKPEKKVFKTGTTTNIDGKRVEPNQELTYSITYKNTTDKDVTATIKDKIPAHTKFVSADNGGIFKDGVITWEKSVSKGKSITVTFVVKVDSDTAGEVLKNKARVNDGTNDYDTNEVTNPTPTKPEKKVFKTGTTTSIDGKRVEAGQILDYAITYKNTTGEDVTATITDKLPEYTEFVSAGEDGVNNNGTVTWTKKVEKDKSITVTFKVKVKTDVNGEVVKNKAKVNDGKNDYDTNEVTNPTPTKPEKKVFKSGTTTNIDGKKVNAGDELTYAITYKNTTGEKVTAKITDKIPQYTEFVSADNGGKYENGTVAWTKEVEKDKSITVTFKVKVKADVNGEVLKNKAKVNDGKNDYDTNEVTNPTPTKPKKEVFKSGTTTNIDGKKVNAGDELTYAITYKNTTGKEADVTITDKLPRYTTFVSADKGGAYEGGVVKWRAKLKNGESITVTFKVKVKDSVNGEVIKNVARVNDGSNEYDTNEVTNPTPVKPQKPRTGDDTNVMALLMLLIGSLGATTYVYRRKKL